MGFYLRDSIKLGPFRLNLSRSGIGVSVGVKGLRIGTGPRGPYLHAGRDGLYYRTSLGRPALAEAEARDIMTPVVTTPASLLAQGEVSGLIAALNARRAKLRLREPLAILAFGVAIYGIAEWGLLTLYLLLLAPLAWIMGGKLDRRRRTTRWTYPQNAAETYQGLRSAFDTLARCQGRWRVFAGRPVRGPVNWKRHAGAAHVITRKAVTMAAQLPLLLDSNLVPPAILTSGLNLYLLPDMVLMEDGSGFASVDYADLMISWETSLFIEDGSVPSDTEIIDRVWAHPNQNGGPDQRFRGNRELPRCRYAQLRMTSESGFDLLLQFSHSDSVGPFARAMEAMSGEKKPGSMWDKALTAATEQARAQVLKCLPPQ